MKKPHKPHHHQQPSPTQLALLGPVGTFSDLAADIYCQQHQISPEKIYKTSIREALESITPTTWALAPIENLIYGFVGPTLDYLEQAAVHIVAELTIPIDHTLAAAPGTSKKNITTIFVQFATSEQCGKFLANMPQVQLITTASNALSAEQARKTPNAAAIVPRYAVDHFSLNILDENVADVPTNRTRFILLAPGSDIPLISQTRGHAPLPISQTRGHAPLSMQETTPDATPSKTDSPASNPNHKTSLFIHQVVYDKPGSLCTILNAFADRDINLLSIMSRPTKEDLGKYHFFIDVDGYIGEDTLDEALTAIRHHANVKILGSYEKTGLN